MIDRRAFVRSVVAVPLVGFAGLPQVMGCAVSARQPHPQVPLKPAGSRLNVLCVGAHPDDPESGCGGTLLRYSEAGHSVSILYLTAGEKGISGASLEDAGKTRMQEARDACAIMGATALFVGQINGNVEVTPGRTEEFAKIFEEAKPDVVFTQWPIDTDWEHQAASILTLRAYVRKQRPIPLFYYEVETGAQTIGFTPTLYVDISKTRERKVEALHAHKSQSFEHIYDKHHEPMEAFRGRELGSFAAEAFVPLGPDARSGLLPGI